MSFLDKLNNSNSLLLKVDLYPKQGDRFQPTGFPNLGAAEYKRPDGVSMVLVESAQSMANRLEKMCLNDDGPMLNHELDGLPYVVSRISFNGKQIVTSSLIEPHRLNSPFILDGKDGNEKFIDKLKSEMNYSKGQPLDWNKIASVILKYDPNSLLHGVFFANMEGGRIKIQRAVTGFIEAEDASVAESGGAKINLLGDPKGKIRVAENSKDIDDNVYGNVLYNRIEYTAKHITAFFSIDLSLIRGYRLGPEAERLLISLSLYKIRRFLNSGLRLRTACDLKVNGKIESSVQGFELPDENELLKTVKEYIGICKQKGLFSENAVTELVVEAKEFTDKDQKSDQDNQDQDKETND